MAITAEQWSEWEKKFGTRTRDAAARDQSNGNGAADDDDKRGAIHIHVHGLADLAKARDDATVEPGSAGQELTNLTGGGKAPGGAVGATMVQRLTGPATAYFVATDPETGAAALYRAADVDDLMEGQDPEKSIGTSDSKRMSLMQQMRRKAEVERATTRGRLALLQKAAGG